MRDRRRSGTPDDGYSFPPPFLLFPETLPRDTSWHGEIAPSLEVLVWLFWISNTGIGVLIVKVCWVCDEPPRTGETENNCGNRNNGILDKGIPFRNVVFW